MTIKRILVPLTGSAKYDAEIDLAVSVAKAMEAHVEGLHISQPLQSRSAYYTQGSAALAAVQTELANDATAHAQEAREQFALACLANGIPMLEADQEPHTLPSASWRETDGLHIGYAAERAAAFDLVVAASAAVTESLKDIAEQSLLETRRPVLLAPAKLNTKLTDPAMIAWDESPECWHAISAAIPFLKLAESVRVVSVDKNPERRSASQGEALRYLHCHGIRATAHVIALQPELGSVGDMLLASAAEYDSGLLVMGAYSHSRLRELLLGGATRHVLQSASTRPVLMAH